MFLCVGRSTNTKLLNLNSLSFFFLFPFYINYLQSQEWERALRACPRMAKHLYVKGKKCSPLHVVLYKTSSFPLTNLKFCPLVRSACSSQVQQHLWGLPGFHQIFYHFMFILSMNMPDLGECQVQGKVKQLLIVSLRRNRSQMFSQVKWPILSWRPSGCLLRTQLYAQG